MTRRISKTTIVIVTILVLLVIALVLVYKGMEGPNQNIKEAVVQSTSKDSSSLVVYFSRANGIEISEVTDATASASLNLQGKELAGNTEIIAQEIAKATSSDIFPIVTENAYSVNVNGTLFKAAVEMFLRSRPEIAGDIENMEKYDVIYLGYPNWDGTIPMAVATFLETNDLSGKTIVPFTTHKGSVFGSSVDMIKDISGDVTVYPNGWSSAGESAASDSTKKDAAEWATSVMEELERVNTSK